MSQGKGINPVQGKGECFTYWLCGKVGQEDEQPYAPSPELLSQVQAISAGGPILQPEHQISITVG